MHGSDNVLRCTTASGGVTEPLPTNGAQHSVLITHSGVNGLWISGISELHLNLVGQRGCFLRISCQHSDPVTLCQSLIDKCTTGLTGAPHDQQTETAAFRAHWHSSPLAPQYSQPSGMQVSEKYQQPVSPGGRA